jgi:hypothetical protein
MCSNPRIAPPSSATPHEGISIVDEIGGKGGIAANDFAAQVVRSKQVAHRCAAKAVPLLHRIALPKSVSIAPDDS